MDTIRNAPRAGPQDQEPARHDQHSTKNADRSSPATVAHDVARVFDLAAYQSWIATVEWLNAHGCAAPVPEDLVAPLARRGLAVWAAGSRGTA